MAWHPHILKMLRTYPNDPGTPDHLRPNRLMEEAADHIDALEKELSDMRSKFNIASAMWSDAEREIETIQEAK